jgi:endopeptidase La
MADKDIQDFIKIIRKQNKRKLTNVDDVEILNDLKWIAYDTITDFVKSCKSKTNRQITSALNILEHIFKDSSKLFMEMTKDEEIKLTMNAFSYILTNIIEDMRLEIYSSTNFDFNKYVNSCKNKLANKRAKLVDDVGLKFDVSENMNEKVSEEDSEAETTDDEDYDPEEDMDDEEEDNNLQEFDELKFNNNPNKEIIKNFHNELKESTAKNENVDTLMEYFSSLDNEYKKDLIEKFKHINSYSNDKVPSLIKVLNMNTSREVKKTLISKMNKLNSAFGDKNKLQTWVEHAMKIPFGVNKGINIKKLNKNKHKVTKFLNKLRTKMDKAIYGHDKAKEQVMMMMAQNIRNPESKGNVFGLWGPPGNGKTSLIKEGIAKAMKKPFIFISLGGATDASYLDGHSYTYEGSIYGRIVQGLMNSQCMDPIIYFDELDKVSNTPKGDEIINLLIHMIDPSQNTHFKDKYFYDLDIDLSRVTFIFSFNDPSNVNYILMDRITTIETKYLTTEQKVIIGKDYLLPSILKDVGLNKDDINIDNNLMEHLVLKYTYEGGVRKLKQLLYEIVRKLNQNNLTKTKLNKKSINFPLNLKLSDVDILLKDYRKISRDKIHDKPQVGMVNGLWANSMGIGGVLPIESSLIPAKDFMNVKATGSLKNVMKESIQVALSVAWNYLDDNIKKQYMEKWENKPETFHIHCPDGAVPKDGPSAGAAMTLVMYSHLSGLSINNKVAMTGEINLRGNVTAIGGLEEKLVGAKLAGVELALIPEENREDFEKILFRIPDLVDNNFRVEIISHFSQIPNLVK